MNFKYYINYKGDESVGISSQQFKVELNITPDIDFNEMDIGDDILFKNIVDKKMKELLECAKDFFNNDEYPEIFTEEELDKGDEYEVESEKLFVAPIMQQVGNNLISEWRVIK